MLMHEERLFAKIQYPLVTKNKQPNIERNICNVLNLGFKINVNGEESKIAKTVLKWDSLGRHPAKLNRFYVNHGVVLVNGYKPKCIRAIPPLKENLILDRGRILLPKWVKDDPSK